MLCMTHFTVTPPEEILSLLADMRESMSTLDIGLLVVEKRTNALPIVLDGLYCVSSLPWYPPPLSPTHGKSGV